MFKVVIKRGKSTETYLSKITTREEAECRLIDAVSNTISNFDEYTSCDIDAIKEQGYENFGGGTIKIVEY